MSHIINELIRKNGHLNLKFKSQGTRLTIKLLYMTP